MSETNKTHFEGAEPILRVEDMARSVTYYVDVLGFTNAPWGNEQFTAVSRESVHRTPDNCH